jgi:hypothetical protein
MGRQSQLQEYHSCGTSSHAHEISKNRLATFLSIIYMPRYFGSRRKKYQSPGETVVCSALLPEPKKMLAFKPRMPVSAVRPSATPP